MPSGLWQMPRMGDSTARESDGFKFVALRYVVGNLGCDGASQYEASDGKEKRFHGDCDLFGGDSEGLLTLWRDAKAWWVCHQQWNGSGRCPVRFRKR